MTKEEYLKIRSSPSIPIVSLFEYYKEMGGYLNDIVMFEQLLSMFITERAVFTSKDDGFKEVTNESVYRKFHEYYGKKFEL